LLLFAVIILHLDTDNQNDGAINSDSIVPSVRGLLNCLDDHIDGTEDDEQLQSEVREGLLDQLKECLDLGDALDVCAITITINKYRIKWRLNTDETN
jgi:hypothetical protein